LTIFVEVALERFPQEPLEVVAQVVPEVVPEVRIPSEQI